MRARCSSNSSRTERGRCVAVRFRSSAVTRKASRREYGALDLLEIARKLRRVFDGAGCAPSGIIHGQYSVERIRRLHSFCPEVAPRRSRASTVVDRECCRIEIFCDLTPLQRRRDAWAAAARARNRRRPRSFRGCSAGNRRRRVPLGRAFTQRSTVAILGCRSATRRRDELPRSFARRRSARAVRAATRCECRSRRTSWARRASPSSIEHVLHRVRDFDRPGRTVRVGRDRDR